VRVVARTSRRHDPLRSLADQNDHQLGGRLSVLVRQRQDHIRLDRLLRELAGTEPEQQDPVLRRIYRLAFPHAFAEESVLWPVFRRVLPDGPELTLRIEREHQEINELVRHLEGLSKTDPQRPEALARLVRILKADVRDEEDLLLPRVQDVVAPRSLRLLGVAWEAVRRVAPTRAHPAVSRRPPGNALAALPLSVLDRLRDTVDRALQVPRGRAATAWKGLSELLAVLTHHTERLAPFSRGEHPATSRP
jgi:hemerythrin superfamily protein